MKPLDWTDFNTYGILASIIGLFVSLLAFLAADSAKKAARKIQDSFLFEKRIPQHLKALDDYMKNYNELLSNIEENSSEIRVLLAQIKSELSSLSMKIKTKSAFKRIDKTISLIDRKINKSFYKETDTQRIHLKFIDLVKNLHMTSHKSIWDIYTYLNEIHTQVNNLRLDNKYLIK